MGAEVADKHYYAIGHDLAATSPTRSDPVDGVEIADLTIDCTQVESEIARLESRLIEWRKSIGQIQL